MAEDIVLASTDQVRLRRPTSSLILRRMLFTRRRQFV